MHKRQLKVKAFSSAHAGSKARHSAEQSPASEIRGRGAEQEEKMVG